MKTRLQDRQLKPGARVCLGADAFGLIIEESAVEGGVRQFSVRLDSYGLVVDLCGDDLSVVDDPPVTGDGPRGRAPAGTGVAPPAKGQVPDSVLDMYLQVTTKRRATALALVQFLLDTTRAVIVPVSMCATVRAVADALRSLLDHLPGLHPLATSWP